MRKLILTIFIFNVGLLISQTKPSDVNFQVFANPANNILTISIKSESDSLKNYIVKIIDSQNKIIKTVNLPKADLLIKSDIPIHDLNADSYFCVILNEKKEVYKTAFNKDLYDSKPVISLTNPQK